MSQSYEGMAQAMPVEEVCIEQAVPEQLSRLHQIAAKVGYAVARTALALGLTVGGTIAAEAADPAPAHAAIETGGYPEWNMPCVSAKDPQRGETQGEGYWCDNYEWGDVKSGNQYSSRGYGYRNCTDWAAFRAPAVAGKGVPRGWGNAKNWDDAARKAGYSVDSTPEVGDIAVWEDGSYGHVAIVESLNPLKVSEFNKNRDGKYGTRTNPAGIDHYIDLNGPSSSGSEGTGTPPPVPWSFENLEGDPHAISPHSGNVGVQPESIVFDGQLYVFHYDADHGDLRYARTAPYWVSDILDGAGGTNGRYDANVGNTPEAAVYNGQLHLFYYDATHGNLRHARSQNGVEWQVDNVDGDPGSHGRLDANVGPNPEAIVHNGKLHVFYKDATNGNLREAILEGNTWIRFVNLDGDSGSFGGYNIDTGNSASAMLYGNALHVFYPDNTNGNLRHAWSDDGLRYRFENIDGDLGSLSRYNADVGYNPVAISYYGVPHVLYYNKSLGNLRHAWVSPTGWRFEELAGDRGSITGYDGNIGTMTSAINFGGSLQAFTYDVGRGEFVHVFHNNTGWHVENLDGNGGQPGRVEGHVGVDSTTVDFGGTLNTFYYDATNTNLRHAWAR